MTRPYHILFVFVDGMGLGDADASYNPLAGNRAGFARLSGGHPWTAGLHAVTDDLLFRPIDACLGVDGFPQSGTGQATLFTGVNCAQLAGRHYGPFPHSTSRPAIRERSIFRRVADRFGASSTAFANAFPPRFFEVMAGRDRWPVTTRACLDAGVRIRTMDDLRAGRAIAADLTAKGLAGMGLSVSARTPEHSADHALDLASDHRFTLVEIFHTDKAGHARDRRRADAVLDDLDRFLTRLTSERPSGLLLVLTSDHGNLEDLRVRTHTLNPVPLAATGPGAGQLDDVRSLVDVTPAVVGLLAD